MSKSELQQACEDKGITISSVHLALESDPDENLWKDKWTCTVSYEGRSATFEYWKGIGNRVLAPGWKVDGYRKWYHTMGHMAIGLKQAIEKGALVLKRIKNEETGLSELKGPAVADVLMCVLNSTRSCTTTFDDWCSDYGENNDSIKTLNNYLACQREGSKVIKLLGQVLVDELAQKEH